MGSCLSKSIAGWIERLFERLLQFQVVYGATFVYLWTIGVKAYIISMHHIWNGNVKTSATSAVWNKQEKLTQIVQTQNVRWAGFCCAFLKCWSINDWFVKLAKKKKSWPQVLNSEVHLKGLLDSSLIAKLIRLMMLAFQRHWVWSWGVCLSLSVTPILSRMSGREAFSPLFSFCLLQKSPIIINQGSV